MEKRNFKSIIVMMVAFVAVSANAQKRVSISWEQGTKNPQACGEYLMEHPKDTLVAVKPGTDLCRLIFFNGTAKLQIREERISATAVQALATPSSTVQASTSTSTPREIEKIRKNEKQVEVSFKDGSEMVLDRRASSADMTPEERRAFLNDELFATDEKHRDMENKNRHKVNVGLVGGGRYVDGYFSPYAGVRAGYESCHFLFELEGGVTSSKYTEVAKETGSYASLNVQFNAGWKFWQDWKYRHYVAVVGGIGAGFQKTDSKEVSEASSQNYATQFELALRGSYTFVKGWKLTLDLGAGSYGKVRHDERQDLSNIGPFGKLGICHSF